MDAEQVRNLILLIKAYYPTLKILDNELDVIIWEDEFKDYDNDLVVQATREICRTSKNGFYVNIASIQEECRNIKRKILEEEKEKKWKEEMDSFKPLPPEEQKKIQDRLEKFLAGYNKK